MALRPKWPEARQPLLCPSRSIHLKPPLQKKASPWKRPWRNRGRAHLGRSYILLIWMVTVSCEFFWASLYLSDQMSPKFPSCVLWSKFSWHSRCSTGWGLCSITQFDVCISFYTWFQFQFNIQGWVLSVLEQCDWWWLCHVLWLGKAVAWTGYWVSQPLGYPSNTAESFAVVHLRQCGSVSTTTLWTCRECLPWSCTRYSLHMTIRKASFMPISVWRSVSRLYLLWRAIWLRRLTAAFAINLSRAPYMSKKCNDLLVQLVWPSDMVPYYMPRLIETPWYSAHWATGEQVCSFFGMFGSE